MSPNAPRESECTKLDSYAAESVTDYMDSWKNMHIAFKQFKQCSETGGPAEGFSDADARLMAKHWDELPQLVPMIADDPAFEEWVIRHLDETDDYADLSKIDHLTQTACPAQAKAFCGKVHAHIQSLDSDSVRCIQAEDKAASEGKHADPSCLNP